MGATDFGASQNLRKFGNQLTSRDPPSLSLREKTRENFACDRTPDDTSIFG
jgi:hypothetical protein